MSDGGLPEMECGGRLRCALVHGHIGTCWAGKSEEWAGLKASRCYARHAETAEMCMRAKDHRGEHEDGSGLTWRKRRPTAASGGREEG